MSEVETNAQREAAAAAVEDVYVSIPGARMEQLNTYDAVASRVRRALELRDNGVYDAQELPAAIESRATTMSEAQVALAATLTLDQWDALAAAGRAALDDTLAGDVTDLAAQTIGPNHQYPDGLLLFTGTMFAPIKDRNQAGQGFTHKVGDLVEVACAELGRLVNRVDYCDRITPWTFGAGALMRNLAQRGLLQDHAAATQAGTGRRDRSRPAGQRCA